jgi:hypothetical protein
MIRRARTKNVAEVKKSLISARLGPIPPPPLGVAKENGVAGRKFRRIWLAINHSSLYVRRPCDVDF